MQASHYLPLLLQRGENKVMRRLVATLKESQVVCAVTTRVQVILLTATAFAEKFFC